MTLMLMLAVLMVALGYAGAMPGGVMEASLSPADERVTFAVQAARDHLQAQHLELINVVRARTQVVQGELLYLRLELSEGYLCDVAVWTRPWLQEVDAIRLSQDPQCLRRPQSNRGGGGGGQGGRPQRPRAVGGQGGQGGGGGGGLLGGVSDHQPLPLPGQDGHDEIRQALEFGACAVNDRENYPWTLVLGDSTEVTFTQQVTSGMTYGFYNVPLVSTDCSDWGCPSSLAQCTPSSRAQVRRCSLRVQHQPWMTPAFSLRHVQCRPESQRP